MQKILALLLSLSCGLVQAEEPAPVPYKEPLVLATLGKSHVTDRHGKKMAAKSQLKLREKVELETEGQSWLLVALTPNERIFLAPNTKVLLPVIAAENGAVDRVELVSGKMRLINLTSTPRVVATSLTRDSYAEADLVFETIADSGRVKLSVLKGKALFRGQENEEWTDLNQGEEATFQGVKENGEWVFDVLLQGKRVARGQMGDKGKVSGLALKEWDENLAKTEKLDATKLANVKKVLERKGSICQKPLGKLNECSWTCQGNPKKEKKICHLGRPGVQCIRRRCDANGAWSDPQVLIPSQAPCGPQVIVKPCDY